MKPIALIVRVAVPVLVTTTGVPALVVLTCWLPNGMLVGATLNAGAVPLPDRATECGLPVAVSVSDRAADFAPVVVGANLTLMVVFALGATVIGSVLFVSENCAASVPVMLMAVIFRSAVPLFVTTTGVAVLVVPTTVSVNGTLVGAAL